MKKRALILAAALLGAAAWAQMTVDPDDSFYRMVEAWELRGLVEDVPPVRPYPLRNVKAILAAVIEGGNERDAAIAGLYWEKLTGKPWTLSAGGEAIYRADAVYDGDDGGFTGDGGSRQLIGTPAVEGDFALFNDYVSMGYRLGMAAFSADEEDFLPRYANSAHDSRYDAAAIGPFDTYLDMNDVLAAGTDRFFAQAGIYRSGYGPFIGEGLAMNDSSYHRASLTLTALAGRWSYVQQYSAVGATKSYDGSDLANNKYFAFHAFEFKFTPRLSAALYESVAFGRRADPSYLMPVPFMVAQVLGGYGDSLLMGLTFKYKPHPGLLVAVDLMADDIDVNEIVKLNLDSKQRIAATAGLVYTPANSFCTRFSLDYTIITPYMYSHWDYDDPNGLTSMNAYTYNYQNYTNSGVAIGSSFAPNSDAFVFSVEFRPVPRLSVRVASTFLRHANVAESLTDDEALEYLLAGAEVYATDGSIYTHSMMANGTSDSGTHVDTAWDHLNLLDQRHKMFVVQGGFDVEYEFRRFRWGQVVLKAGYMCEFIRNKGVDSNMYPGGAVTAAADDDGNVTYTWNGKKYGSKEELMDAGIVDHYKSAWTGGFEDVIRNYFRFGVCFKF